jgi:DNA-binding response OmpR family regulator
MPDELKQKIMVVDDDRKMGELVLNVLMPEGWDVIWVGSGLECLERMEGGFKGLILLDIQMAAMDGWDTLREIVNRGLFPGNLVCMLTGETEPGNKSEGLEEYVLDYITKPFKTQALITKIRYALDCLHS